MHQTEINCKTMNKIYFTCNWFFLEAIGYALWISPFLRILIFVIFYNNLNTLYTRTLFFVYTCIINGNPHYSSSYIRSSIRIFRSTASWVLQVSRGDAYSSSLFFNSFFFKHQTKHVLSYQIKCPLSNILVSLNCFVICKKIVFICYCFVIRIRFWTKTRFENTRFT